MARRCFEKLILRLTTREDEATADEESLDAESQEGRFPLFCDDLRPTNMLVDLATLRITAVLDWEFTNAMPLQFVEDVPWWLLLWNPARWISGEEEGGREEFEKRFVPRMEQFLRAVERAEARAPAA